MSGQYCELRHTCAMGAPGPGAYKPGKFDIGKAGFHQPVGIDEPLQGSRARTEQRTKLVDQLAFFLLYIKLFDLWRLFGGCRTSGTGGRNREIRRADVSIGCSCARATIRFEKRMHERGTLWLRNTA